MIEAKVIEDSISNEGKRLTTMQLVYPRMVHSELMTHRVFSRNASSSRAIPVKKMIEMVRDNPAMPIYWGKDKPGMQANETIQHVGAAQDIWLRAARNAANIAEEMACLGLHKQVANRILEPFQHMHTLVSSTEWGNFFALRCHPDAQPEMQALANAMRDALDASTPKELKHGEWHLPYVTEDERNDGYFQGGRGDMLCRISTARACRVSYLRHDQYAPSIKDDLALCDKLMSSRPIHASPFEHIATPDILIVDGEGGKAWAAKEFHRNFVGWIQYRGVVEQRLRA